MALTITQKMRADLGGKAIRNYEIVHDGSTNTVTAASLDMNYIEGILGQQIIMSMQAFASVTMGVLNLSIAAGNKGILWSESDANAKTRVTLFGW
jgi:hypothetical protein